jgi:hypothetical protein
MNITGYPTFLRIPLFGIFLWLFLVVHKINKIFFGMPGPPPFIFGRIQTGWDLFFPQSKALFFVPGQGADRSGRHSHDDAIGGNIRDNDGTCSHDWVPADTYVGQQLGPSAYNAVILNNNGPEDAYIRIFFSEDPGTAVMAMENDIIWYPDMVANSDQVRGPDGFRTDMGVFPNLRAPSPKKVANGTIVVTGEYNCPQAFLKGLFQTGAYPFKKEHFFCPSKFMRTGIYLFPKRLFYKWYVSNK